MSFKRGIYRIGDNLKGCHLSRLHLPSTSLLKNSIRTKLPIILLVMGLAGCQQKSDIDKCVDAQAIVMCNRLIDAEPGKKIIWYKAAEMTEDQCVQFNKKLFVGDWHLECLKAQSGKK